MCSCRSCGQWPVPDRFITGAALTSNQINGRGSVRINPPHTKNYCGAHLPNLKAWTAQSNLETAPGGCVTLVGRSGAVYNPACSTESMMELVTCSLNIVSCKASKYMCGHKKVFLFVFFFLQSRIDLVQSNTVY